MEDVTGLFWSTTLVTAIRYQVIDSLLHIRQGTHMLHYVTTLPARPQLPNFLTLWFIQAELPAVPPNAPHVLSQAILSIPKTPQNFLLKMALEHWSLGQPMSTTHLMA